MVYSEGVWSMTEHFRYEVMEYRHVSLYCKNVVTHPGYTDITHARL